MYRSPTSQRGGPEVVDPARPVRAFKLPSTNATLCPLASSLIPTIHEHFHFYIVLRYNLACSQIETLKSFLRAAAKPRWARSFADRGRFRYALRKFLRFSEDAAKQCGVTPQQHQLMLGVAGYAGGSATISELAEFLHERVHSVVGLVERAEQTDWCAQREATRTTGWLSFL